jgi:hypothetical protein
MTTGGTTEAAIAVPTRTTSPARFIHFLGSSFLMFIAPLS